MNKPSLLLQEKEDLADQILEQHAQIEKLRQEIEKLRRENAVLKEKVNPFKKKSPEKSAKKSKPPRQWGRKPGHPGSWRPVPDHIDKEVDLKLSHCPICRHELKPSNKFHEHLQEEIIPARVEVTRYKHYESWCGECHAAVIAPHAPDETGWKINGKNHWLWAFVNEMWAYYVIHQSRASKVPKEVLGNPVQGILISDFHGAYGKLQGKKQKCLVHLKREMKECRGKDPPEEYRGPYRKLRRILSDAVRLEQRRSQLGGLVFRRRVRRLKERLTDFACAPYQGRNWKRLSKRLLKHEDEMFTFLDFPGLPKDNNQAERLIRPHVILRNRSFQNRTERGAGAYGRLTSIINSLILQKRNALGEIQRAYPLHRQRALLELPARPEIFSPSAAGNH